MIYQLKNTGLSPRILMNSNGRRATIMPGQIVSIELKFRTAKALWTASQHGGKLVFLGDVTFPTEPDVLSFKKSASEVEPTGDRGEDTIDGGGEDTTDGGGDGGEEPLDRKNSAKTLVESVSQIPYPEFISRAKILIGEDWPGGTPRKTTVVEMLEKIANEE